MAAPKRIDELTAGTSLSAGAAVAVVQDGATLRFPASAFITQAESFTQSGSGAVARTVQAKLREVEVSVTDFGAVGDNVTNDASAIQSAITAAGVGGKVRFPKASAKYFIGTTTLTMLEAQHWIGEGYDNTTKSGAVIRYTGTGNAIESTSRSSTRIFRNRIADIGIIGASKTAGSCGIDLRRVDKIRIERVLVNDMDIGIRFDGTGTGGFRNLCYDCEVIGNNTGYQTVTSANEQLILGGTCNTNTNYGLDVQGGNSVTSFNVNYESNGVHVRTAAPNTRVLFGRMEDATTNRWETTSVATYFSIQGVHLASGSGQTYLDAGSYSDIREIDRNSARGVNLIKNGSFEVWSVSTAPDGWTRSNVTAAEDTDAADIREGSSSVLLTASASTSGSMLQDYSIPTFLQDGRRQFLAFTWAKLGTSTQAAFQTSPQTGAGSTAGSVLGPDRTSLGSNQTLITDSDWQFVYQVVQPSATAVRIRVSLFPDRALGTGTCNFDAVGVVPLGGWDQEYYRHPDDLHPSWTKVLSQTASLNFADTASGAAADLTITVNGAADGDSVILGIPNGAIVAGAAGFYAWVSAANTVTVRFWNASGGNLNPGSATFRVDVVKH